MTQQIIIAGNPTHWEGKSYLTEAVLEEIDRGITIINVDEIPIPEKDYSSTNIKALLHIIPVTRYGSLKDSKQQRKERREKERKEQSKKDNYEK